MSRTFLKNFKIFFRKGTGHSGVVKPALLCYHNRKQKLKGDSTVVEIVFSESARGSLVVGQSYGKGKYPGGAVGVLLHKEDGTRPTEAELRDARARAREQHRREWENAVPMGGKPGDVYGFDLAWSMGEICEDGIGDRRRAVLEKLSGFDPPEACARLEEKLEAARKALDAVLERCAAGEDVRIWYSHAPDEMCGMHWFMARLGTLKRRGTVWLVRLPEWEYREDGVILSHNGWGEIGPGQWGSYRRLQQEAKPAFFAVCAEKWSRLREENAPLRVFLNGSLQSAPEDIYDSFILREIEAQPRVFPEPLVIGNVLGKYRLGIGDAWVALRIEKLIEKGMLEILEPAPEGDCGYRRKLRKHG